MAGANQVIMLALSVIAGMVGGGGLGELVVQSVTQSALEASADPPSFPKWISGA